MRKLLFIFVSVLLAAGVYAQSPQKMSYQAVIRNTSDALVTDTEIGMQISILQGSTIGTAVYVETQTPTTNANGLVSIEIGAGTVLNGDFATIDWANGPYFIKTETDPAGGTSYTITGTSQLLSVPYALHAKTAEMLTGGITETDPVFNAWDKSTGISITESQISDLDHFTTADEIDPVFGAWDKSTGISITESQISDLGNYIETETDPEFGAWDKSTGISITESQISDLGIYLETETDPRVPTGNQIGQMQYWNGAEWTTIAEGTTGQKLTNLHGIPIWIDNDENVDPNTGQVWRDVISSTGQTWMDRNLGASRAATSSTDSEAYGDLYQWGRGTDGHEKRTSGNTSTLSTTDIPGHDDFITVGSHPYDWRNPPNDDLWQGVSGTNNPCPSGYRIPTEGEWAAEIASWSSNDAVGAFDSPLKLTVAGKRLISVGTFNDMGSRGYYSSSTVGTALQRYLYFTSSTAAIESASRAYGHSVRCIKD
ncbi:MAG: FISUMP domain-containing protein [Bacteroidales bacterium]|nr:FISUMP domain-containing protein [Bacteroidales bacterium]